MPGFVITNDNDDIEHPFKPLPTWPYLQALSQAWIENPILFVPKSRQLMVTWLFCSIASHELLFMPGRRTAMISKKFTDAQENLLGRVKTIRDHIPISKQLVPLVSHNKTTGIISCSKSSSSIHALTEDSAKDSRGWTFSWIFSDEFDFQENVDEQYRAALATIKGKSGSSRYTAVSTPDGEGLFYSIVSDTGSIAQPAGR